MGQICLQSLLCGLLDAVCVHSLGFSGRFIWASWPLNTPVNSKATSDFHLRPHPISTCGKTRELP
jgi:hypothetical protein